MIHVVTVYTPRKHHEKWMDYGPLLKEQVASVWRLPDHHHVLVSDHKFKGLNVLHAPLPACLMHAMLAGQIAYLEQWDDSHPVVLVDVDCLVGRNLHPVFYGEPFDIGLTNRNGPHVSPVNNGAMYVQAGSKARVLSFFKRAYDLCGTHWGGDQEAISQAAAPVPYTHGIETREDGLRINFLSMFTHNVTPEFEGVPHKHNPYIIHFKGKSRKPWMATYRRRFLR